MLGVYTCGRVPFPGGTKRVWYRIAVENVWQAHQQAHSPHESARITFPLSDVGSSKGKSSKDEKKSHKQRREERGDRREERGERGDRREDGSSRDERQRDRPPIDPGGKRGDAANGSGSGRELNSGARAKVPEKSWLAPHIVVRIVDKKLKGGRYVVNTPSCTSVFCC